MEKYSELDCLKLEIRILNQNILRGKHSQGKELQVKEWECKLQESLQRIKELEK